MGVSSKKRRRVRVAIPSRYQCKASSPKTKVIGSTRLFPVPAAAIWGQTSTPLAPIRRYLRRLKGYASNKYTLSSPSSLASPALGAQIPHGHLVDDWLHHLKPSRRLVQSEPSFAFCECDPELSPARVTLFQSDNQQIERLRHPLASPNDNTLLILPVRISNHVIEYIGDSSLVESPGLDQACVGRVRGRRLACILPLPAGEGMTLCSPSQHHRA